MLESVIISVQLFLRCKGEQSKPTWKGMTFELLPEATRNFQRTVHVLMGMLILHLRKMPFCYTGAEKDRTGGPCKQDTEGGTCQGIDFHNMEVVEKVCRIVCYSKNGVVIFCNFSVVLFDLHEQANKYVLPIC